MAENRDDWILPKGVPLASVASHLPLLGVVHPGTNIQLFASDRTAAGWVDLEFWNMAVFVCDKRWDSSIFPLWQHYIYEEHSQLAQSYLKILNILHCFMYIS